MAKKAPARELPQNAVLCGWCDEFEVRAQRAEKKLADAESYARHLEDLVELVFRPLRAT